MVTALTFSFIFLVAFRAWPNAEFLPNGVVTPDSSLELFYSKCIMYGDFFSFECIEVLKSFDDFVLSKFDLANSPLYWFIFYWIIFGIFEAELLLCVDERKYWGYAGLVVAFCYLLLYLSFYKDCLNVLLAGFKLNSNLDWFFFAFIWAKNGLRVKVTL